MTTPAQGEPQTAARLPRAFQALWASMAVSSVGDGALTAAMPLLAAYLTRDPIGVAVVSVGASLPWFVVGVFAGAWVDRLPRRSVMIVSDVARGAALAVLVTLILAGSASIPLLAVVAFVLTTGQVFFDAAAQAALPQVLGRDTSVLGRANGRLFATQTVGATLAGPPIGGALFGVAPWAPFAVDAASFVASSGFVLGVPRADAPEGGNRLSIRASVREGFAYLFASRILVTLACALTAYNVCFNLASATLVLFAQEQLGVTDGTFGLLLASMSAGAIAIGMVSARVLARIGVGGAVVASLAAQGIGWAGVALSGSVWLAGVSLAATGAASTMVTVAVVSERQSTVPDALLGRVTSAFRLIGNGFAPLGGVAGGLLAGAAGLRAPLIAAPVLLALCVVVFGLLLTRRAPINED
nr:MFS transporter [Kineosporia sp. R_H_3]